MAIYWSDLHAISIVKWYFDFFLISEFIFLLFFGNFSSMMFQDKIMKIKKNLFF